jgi:hypothetical protein
MPVKDLNVKRTRPAAHKSVLTHHISPVQVAVAKKDQTLASSQRPASFYPNRINPANVLALQRLAGNSATCRLFSQASAASSLQSKLTPVTTLQRFPEESLRNRSAEISTPTAEEVKTSPTTPAASASEADIDALDLAPVAKTAAQELKKKHPEISFTSGRRNITTQAHAMATNVIDSDRKWIEKTYLAAAKLQKWVDDHPDAKTVAAVAAGLEETMNAMTSDEVGKISKHLTGEAFDVQPQEKDADVIKKDILGLTGLTKFLEKEGGLVRWHAQF